MTPRTDMRVVSVNVGLPRDIEWKGRIYRTAIIKDPVEGRVAVRRHNLAGDRQAERMLHGGPDKAVYVYPAEHYAFWRPELAGIELGWGAFGENLTTEGLVEDEVRIGDRYAIGSAEIRVTEPRMPCFKMVARFRRPDIAKRFLANGLTGFYSAVAREGETESGAPIRLLERDPSGVAVAEITRLFARDRDDLDGLRRALAVRSLPESWRAHFGTELARRDR